MPDISCEPNYEIQAWSLTPNIDDTLSSVPSTEPTSYVAEIRTPEGTSTVEFSGAHAESIANEFVKRANSPGRLTPVPGEARLCMICATKSPWGIWDSNSGASVCIACRDKARS